MRLLKLHATRSRGFTLVELLMVMLIISILAGLLLSGIFVALSRAKEARLVIQLDQLTLALNEYKNTYGEIPPSTGEGAWNFATINGDRRNLTLHMRRAFPQAVELGDLLQGTASGNFQNINTTPAFTCPWVGNTGSITPDFRNLDAAESLVFFLGGPPVRITGTGGDTWATQGFSANPRNPLAPGYFVGDELTANVVKQRKPKLFDFPPGSLADQDNDNWPEFYPEKVAAPVVYFRGPYTTYTGPAVPLSYPKVSDTNRRALLGVAVPYMVSYTDANSLLIAENWVNPTGFQLILAGTDNFYGLNESTTPRVYKRFSTDQTTGQMRDWDNLSNFSRGRVGEGS